MGLVTTKEMFKKAYDGGYAIGAFNVNNMEIIQGITEAAGNAISCYFTGICRGQKICKTRVFNETRGSGRAGNRCTYCTSSGPWG